jgi:2-dehydropantoate 2-reductase
MRVLVVGAGAVGTVYARFLQAGGATVAFRVRDPARVGTPLRVYPLRGDRAPVEFAAPVLGTDDETRAFAADLVLLTVPTDALAGPWLTSVLTSTGTRRVVALEPGPDAEARLRAALPEMSLTQGVISLIAYQAPLPGEPGFDPPGVALWVPPLTKAPFEGPDAAEIAAVLTRGGLPSRATTGLGATSVYGSALLGVWIAALRAGGWSLASLAGQSARAGRALTEANAVLARKTGWRRPLALALLGPPMVRATFRLAARVLPLPLEPDLRFHFTKVGGQMEEALRELIAEGERQSVPTPALAELTRAAFGS